MFLLIYCYCLYSFFQNSRLEPSFTYSVFHFLFHFCFRFHDLVSNFRILCFSADLRTYACAYSWNLEGNVFLLNSWLHFYHIKLDWLINFSHYIGAFVLVFRLSLFLLFHKTWDGTTAISFLFIYRNCLAEDAGNGISKTLNLKSLWGSSPLIPLL